MNTTEVIDILKQVAASSSPNSVRELRSIAEDVYFSGNPEYAVSALRFISEDDPYFNALLKAVSSAKNKEAERQSLQTDFD